MTPIAGETAHQWLRRATAQAHADTERLFAPFDLTQKDGLLAFLSIHAVVVLPLEAEFEARQLSRMVPDWLERRRGTALEADLRALGAVPPMARSSGWRERLPSDAHLMGACYVVEGSRLGGTLLKRRALLSHDPLVREATGYLGHAVAPGAWRAFLAELDRSDMGTGSAEALLVGAQAVFAAFSDSACHIMRRREQGFTVAKA